MQGNERHFAGKSARGGFTDEERQPHRLRFALQSRGEIHRISHGRIGEAHGGAHVADDAIAGVDADTDAKADGRFSCCIGFGGQFLVQPVDRIEHAERGASAPGG